MASQAKQEDVDKAIAECMMRLEEKFASQLKVTMVVRVPPGFGINDVVITNEDFLLTAAELLMTLIDKSPSIGTQQAMASIIHPSVPKDKQN